MFHLLCLLGALIYVYFAKCHRTFTGISSKSAENLFDSFINNLNVSNSSVGLMYIEGKLKDSVMGWVQAWSTPSPPDQPPNWRLKHSDICMEFVILQAFFITLTPACPPVGTVLF
ncbi:hypothetical protein ABEB36_000396 [Hypothenemus hampei]|uniref:Uncharacterized protein n=1 Tax=Hypothenemus hampei TaxID=57062 RepID=A0ABD1FB50_HYPHA